ncbi:MAG: hypothetical protein ACYC1T_10955 [Sulfuricaulis sp.]
MAPAGEAHLKCIDERFGPRREHRFEQLAFELGTPALNDVWTFHGLSSLPDSAGYATVDQKRF